MPILGDYPTPGRMITIRPDPANEYFECPECSSSHLEEVARALTYSSIPCFYRGQYDYGETETEYMESVRIQCGHCGFTVAEGFPRNLYEYVLMKGWIKDRGPTESNSADWEA